MECREYLSGYLTHKRSYTEVNYIVEWRLFQLFWERELHGTGVVNALLKVPYLLYYGIAGFFPEGPDFR